MKKKFQVFISSTYEDLKEERQVALRAVLNCECIPAGMELFVAEDKKQMDIIKNWIDDSDYYLLIVAGRYGSVNIETGKSYTQLEYEYAVEKKIPILAFLYKNYKDFDTYKNEKYKDKLDYFIDEVFNKGKRNGGIFEDITQLNEKIILSINKQKNDNPGLGWYREDSNIETKNALEKKIEEQNTIIINLKKAVESLKSTNQLILASNSDLNKQIDMKNSVTGKKEFLEKEFVLTFQYSNLFKLKRHKQFSFSWKDLFYNSFKMVTDIGITKKELIDKLEDKINKKEVSICSHSYEEFCQKLITEGLIEYIKAPRNENNDVFGSIFSSITKNDIIKLTKLGKALLNKVGEEK